MLAETTIHVSSSVGIETDWTAEELRFDSRQSQEIFLFFTASRLARLTQTPIQWVPGGCFFGVKRQGREADHLAPRSRIVELYFQSPIRLHGVVFN
jgi:hypothetical protein